MSLTHFDDQGKAIMVDVSDKAETKRVAVAEGRIFMKPETLKMIVDKKLAKGDVLGTARLAGIMAVKKTPELIPLCHPLLIEKVAVDMTTDTKSSSVTIRATVTLSGKTGVEMEALTAVSVTALTIYDMVKAVDKGMVISDITLIEKKGGKSGHYLRDGHQPIE